MLRITPHGHLLLAHRIVTGSGASSFSRFPMEPNQCLGWLSVALVPGLGARMAGKLLRDFGTPEAIFNAMRP